MRAGLLAVLLLLVVGTATSLAATPNVRGIVTRGPITPVCREGVKCDGPAAGVVLVFSRSGTDVARIVTRDDGRFVLTLRPGTYGVRQVRRPTIGGLAPRFFRVARGRQVVLRLSIDTGIR